MARYVGITSQQRKNNTYTLVMLILFPFILILFTWIAFVLIYSLGTDNYEIWDFTSPENTTIYTSMLYVLIGCGIWFVIAYFFNVKMIQSATHAKPLERKENKRVYNLVENLCIETNMHMPQINIIEDSSLNAFASGINTKTYTVTLTRGIIDMLDDDELEGVIAHELTHIRNRDVRLLIVSIVFVGIFSFIAQVMYHSLLFGNHSSKSNNKKSDGKNPLMIIIIIALATIAYAIAILMRFSISRKREYMADAGAAEITHKPWALASALRKISGAPMVADMDNDSVAQLFIANPLKKKEKTSIFATHPPISKRIEILEQF